ncbi:MAG: hypothetical protein OWQ48_02480 [Desulfurococcus sp.]|nr:hypothetical protein [Desulfurococcus sp.]
MNKKKATGIALITGSILIAVVYTYLLFFSNVKELVLKLTVYAFVILLLASLFALGFTLLKSKLIQPDEDGDQLECSSR